MTRVREWANVHREDIKDYLNVMLAVLLVVVLVVTVSLSIQVQRRNNAINRIESASNKAQTASEEVAEFVRELRRSQAEAGENPAGDAAVAEGLQNIKEIEDLLRQLVEQNN